MDDVMPNAMLIEDDALVATMSGDSLEELGYGFVLAANAAAARDIAGRDGLGQFDLALIDVGLPDGRGDALAVELRDLRADLPIIIATGYGDNHLDSRLKSMSVTAVLAKPFDSAQLQAAIDAVSAPLGRTA